MLYGSGPLPPTNPQCNAEMLLFIFSSGPIMVCKSTKHVSSWPALQQINFEGCCLLFNLCYMQTLPTPSHNIPGLPIKLLNDRNGARSVRESAH